MAWFKSGIDERTKELVAEVAAAYAERAQLSHRLLTKRPRVTATEMAAIWAFYAYAAEADRRKVPKSERSGWGEALDSTTNAFFLSFCQSFIETICRSTLKLELNEQMLGMMQKTLDDSNMPSKRGKELAALGSAMLMNALRLAGATVGVLGARLTATQARTANRYALSLIKEDPKLNSFERQQATGWLGGISWAGGRN